MAKENIDAFIKLMRNHPELLAQIEPVAKASPEQAALQVARLASDAGLPFSVEELAACVQERGEISEEQLKDVSGGAEPVEPELQPLLKLSSKELFYMLKSSANL